MVAQKNVTDTLKNGCGLLDPITDQDIFKIVPSNKSLNVVRKKTSIEATTRCTVLFGYIKEKKWDALLEKLAYFESDAKEWIEEKNDDGSTRWKSLLIHLACEHRPPQKVVSELIRINPDSISEKNYGGDLPIHIACRDGASDEVIDVILNCDRYECSKVKDCEGRLPLHLAASNSNICVKTIQNLINVNERATRTPDDFQLLPLHWACSKNASPRIVETLLQAYPYAVEAKDAWERTPLDLAMMSKNPEKAQVVEMLSRNISSWTTGMISTVLTLSNKVLEAEKMEAKLKEQGKYIETFRSQYGKEQPLEALLLEIQYLEKKHTAEIRDMQEKSDEIIAQLRKEKDEAEKKMNNLKTLVDEVVSQLKKHQLMVEEKESERKKLKNSAVSLLNKIDEQNDEVNSLREENKKLKEQLEKIHS